MKRMISLILVLLVALTTVYAFAEESREGPIKPKVVEVDPKDKEEEVVPPTIETVEDPKETTEIQEETKTIYRLTIYYRYLDGTTASATYDTTLQAGTPYNVPSPVIPGYVATLLRVSGVMPERDLQFIVIYIPTTGETPLFPILEETQLLSIEDYEVPLGLGFSMSNLGICME